MNKIIKTIHLNTQYSLIIIQKDDKITEHIVSNNGELPLNYWIEYFEKEY